MQVRHKNLGTDRAEIHFQSVADWARYALNSATMTEQSEALPQELLRKRSDGLKDTIKGYMISDRSEQSAQYRKFHGEINGSEVTRRIENRICDEDMRERINKKLKDIHLDVPPSGEIEAPALFNDESGICLDSTAYFNGEEDCMVNYDFAMATKPIVWLAENICVMAGFTSDSFANKGAALIRLVHALERQNVSVGIIGYSATNQMNGITMIVKQPQDNLDESMLINLFCSCEALRTIDFAIDATIRNDWVGGKPKTMAKEIINNGYADGDQLIVIPYGGWRAYTDEETAVSYYFDKLEKETGIKAA